MRYSTEIRREIVQSLRLLYLRDVAAILCLSESEIHKLVDEGTIVPVRQGSRILFTQAEIRRYIATLMPQAEKSKIPRKPQRPRPENTIKPVDAAFAAFLAPAEPESSLSRRQGRTDPTSR